MHLSPLTGIETYPFLVSLDSDYRCIFHPLRGLKRVSSDTCSDSKVWCIFHPLRGLKRSYEQIKAMICSTMHLSPLTGIETPINLSIQRFAWRCIFLPLRGLKRVHLFNRYSKMIDASFSPCGDRTKKSSNATLLQYSIHHSPLAGI